MNKITLFLIFLISLSEAAFAGKVAPDCTYKGIPLYGKVKIVQNFEDFKVKRVDNFQDIKIKRVDYFPNSCGKWQFVDNFEDFKIKFVDNFEDFKIKFTDNFEGL